MKGTRILWLLLSISGVVWSQLRMEAQLLTPKESFLLCEPIDVEVSWVNEGEEPLKIGPFFKPTESPALRVKVDGEVRDRIGAVVTYEWPVVGKMELDPGERKSGIWDISVNIMEVGSHEVKFVADFKNFPQGFYHGKVESNSIVVNIRMPEGEDWEAYEWSKRLMKEEEYELSGKHAECFRLRTTEILQTYPTSTYAGWVLWKEYTGFNENLLFFHPENVIDYYDRPEEEFLEEQAEMYRNPSLEAVRKGWISPFKRAQAYLELAIPFAEAHPDFAYIGEIYKDIGNAYLVLGDYSKAIVFIRKALSKPLHPTSKMLIPSYQKILPLLEKKAKKSIQRKRK